MSEKLKQIINYIFIGAIFTDALVFSLPPFYYVSVYHVVFFLGILILLFFIKKICTSRLFLIIFAVFLFSSLYNVLLLKNDLFLLFKQFLGLLIHSTFFYMLIKFNNDNLKKLFSVYLQITFFVALIGVIQYVVFWFYQLSISDYHENICRYFRYLPFWRISFCQIGIRVNSISPEPASLCLVTFPAFFVSLYTIISNNKFFLSKGKSTIVILAFIFTYSTIGFIGILISLFFIYKNIKLMKFQRFLITFLFILLIYFLFSVQETKVKFIQTKKAFYGELDWQRTNQTTYTSLRNALVTYEVFKDNPIFGHGIGSRTISFNEYTEKYRIPNPIGIGILNIRDANSLLFRVLSETGLLGILILLFFIFYNFASTKKYGDEFLFIINNSIFILFILRLIRQGNYFSEGFFFFFWLYCLSKKLLNKIPFHTPAQKTSTGTK